jgi:hypothetical protein
MNPAYPKTNDAKPAPAGIEPAPLAEALANALAANPVRREERRKPAPPAKPAAGGPAKSPGQ